MGTAKLADLTPAAVQALRTRLRKQGASTDKIGRVVGALGVILATAMRHGKLGRNVVRDGHRRGKTDKRHEKHPEIGVDIPTRDEITAMLAASQGDVRTRAILMTAVFCGLRASEIRGLRWKDVDLDRATLRVAQRMDRWNNAGSPKSATSRREIPMGPIVVNTLKEWSLKCPNGELGLVFPNRLGKTESLSSLHYRLLEPLQRKAGIPHGERSKVRYGMHSLRHAAASLFIEQGFSPKRVQALMGTRPSR
jgi:integrase